MSKKDYQFKAEMKQLLDILVHSLYTNKDVFLRELVSNSSDALNKVRFRKLTDTSIRDLDKELRIDINIDKEAKTVHIEDTGIGMDEDDLINNLGTIASSGTSKFIESLKSSKDKIDGQNMIGRFGVGFYSVFMVTDEITIDTLKADADSKPLRWISKGAEGFTVTESDRTTRGTSVTFKLNDSDSDFAEDWKIKSVINRYSAFVDFPIYINGEKVNNQKAIWHRSKSEVKEEELNEFYKFISQDYEDPISDLWLNIEGNVNFKSIIFIPKKAPANLFAQDFETNLHLYSSNVFISSNTKELLPDYLKFLKGVVDTEDLPLNVSREVTQNSPVVAKIKDIIASRVLKHLTEMKKNDPEQYKSFFNEFGSMFKTGINSEFKHRDQLLDLLMFRTSESGKELRTLDEYIETADSEKKEIYYLTAGSYEAAENHPHLEAFKKRNLEVLLLGDPIDPFVIPGINKYKEFELKSIENVELDDTTDNDDNDNEEGKKAPDSVVEVFKEYLGERVEDVKISSKLVDSPVALSGASGMDSQMEKMMRMMDKDFKAPKKVLEINPSHQLIKNIHKMYISGENKDILTKATNHILDSALLTEGYLEDPYKYVKQMYDIMADATK
jgi:molecular chaperone HtpG